MHDGGSGVKEDHRDAQRARRVKVGEQKTNRKQSGTDRRGNVGTMSIPTAARDKRDGRAEELVIPRTTSNGLGRNGRPSESRTDTTQRPSTTQPQKKNPLGRAGIRDCGVLPQTVCPQR